MGQTIGSVLGSIEIPTGQNVSRGKRTMLHALKGLGTGLGATAGREEQARARQNALNLQATQTWLQKRATQMARQTPAQLKAESKARREGEIEAGPMPGTEPRLPDTDPILSASDVASFGLPLSMVGKRISQLPMTAQGKIAPRAATMTGTTGLTDEAKDLAARSYLQGAGLPPLGMGAAAAADRRDILNRAARMDPMASIAANEAERFSKRSTLTNLQRTYSMTSAFENTALKNAEIMKSTMAKIPDTGSPFFNTPLRAINLRGAGSAQIAAFNTARRVVVPEFARILAGNPNLAGELSDTARKEVDQILAGNYSMNQMLAALDVLYADARNRNESYKQAIEQLTQEVRDIGGGYARSDSTKEGSVLMQRGGKTKMVPRDQVETTNPTGAVAPVVKWTRDASGKPVRVP